MDPETTKFFKDIREQDSCNLKCFDCGGQKPQWASISHGVLVCLVCSGVHRSLGIHTSFVRSLQLDTWDEKQKKALLLGGNAKALEFFNKHGITQMVPQEKYHTKAALYYRQRLRAEIEGAAFDLPAPAGEEGKKFEDDYVAQSTAAPSSSLFAYTDEPDQFTRPEPAGAGFGGMFASLQSNPTVQNWTEIGSNAFANMWSRGSTMAQTVQEKGLVDSLKTAATATSGWVSEKSQVVAATVTQEDFWSKAQETVIQKAGTAADAMGKSMTVAADWMAQQIGEVAGDDDVSKRDDVASSLESTATSATAASGSASGSTATASQLRTSSFQNLTAAAANPAASASASAAAAGESVPPTSASVPTRLSSNKDV